MDLDALCRHREVMGNLYSCFFLDDKNNYIISIKDISKTFGISEDEIMKNHKKVLEKEYAFINLEDFRNLIKKITEEEQDIRSFNYYYKVAHCT